MPTKLIDRIPETSAKIRQGLGRAVHKFGFELEGDWKKIVPVVTGQYKNSIQYLPQTELTGELVATAAHAAILEFGAKYTTISKKKTRGGRELEVRKTRNLEPRYYLTRLLAQRQKDFPAGLTVEVRLVLVNT